MCTFWGRDQVFFSFFHVDIQLILHHLLKRTSSSPLLKLRWPWSHICKTVPGLCILCHWYIYLFTFKYHIGYYLFIINNVSWCKYSNFVLLQILGHWLSMHILELVCWFLLKIKLCSCTAAINCFGEISYFNIESSSPWIWYILSFL